MDRQTQLQAKYAALRPFLDERRRRLWAANEALALGRGGVKLVAAATGLARSTLGDGLRELRAALAVPGGVVDGVPTWSPALVRQRRPGGGRKARMVQDAALVPALEALVEPTTRGDPQSPLRWTTKSTRKLADELTRQGHPVSATTVAALLGQLKYRLHALRKTTEGASHPTATRSSTTSARRSAPSRSRASRLSRSTPRRRNWWATSRMVDGSGDRAGMLSKCGCTIFRCRSWGG